jgi:hypothetical protein
MFRTLGGMKVELYRFKTSGIRLRPQYSAARPQTAWSVADAVAIGVDLSAAVAGGGAGAGTGVGDGPIHTGAANTRTLVGET